MSHSNVKILKKKKCPSFIEFALAIETVELLRKDGAKAFVGRIYFALSNDTQ